MGYDALHLTMGLYLPCGIHDDTTSSIYYIVGVLIIYVGVELGDAPFDEGRGQSNVAR
jgi:hypothetical protein